MSTPSIESVDGPITYQLRLQQTGLRSSLEVVALVQERHGVLPEPLVFELPHRWAGFEDLGDDLIELAAHGSDGTALPVAREPGRLAVRHDNEWAVTVSYRVVPGARSLRQGSRFHAVGSPDYFFGYGRNIFVWPTHLNRATVPVDIILSPSPAGTTWASTLGLVDTHGELRDQMWRHVVDSAYLAGQVRVFGDLGDPDGTAVVIDPLLGDVDQDLWQTARRVACYSEGRWGPTQIPTTVVFVLRRTDDPFALTGSGRPGGFVVELGERVGPRNDEVVQLVTHEHLHRYIGAWLRFAAEDELLTLWFKEGVVDYLAAEFAVRSGALPAEAFLDAFSEALTGYLTNDTVGQPLVGPVHELWNDSAARRLPYEQGFLLGFHLDLLLRENGDTLDRAVGDLISENAHWRRVGASQLRDFLEERLERDLGWLFDGYIAQGDPLPTRQWLTDAGLTMRQLSRPTPYYGLEVDSTYSGIWSVVAIDPLGPAASLPLSAGDRLWEAPILPTSGYGEHARLTVERDGRPVSLSIPPLPGESRVWSVQPDGNRFDQIMGWPQ